MLKKLLLLTFLVTLPLKAHASEQFDTNYDVKYSINNLGETQVSQEISVINKQKDIFATSYNLTIKEMEIYDVSGTDDEGTIKIVTNTAGNSTALNATFNEQVVGLDRAYVWNLNYKTRDIATKVGEIWTIYIPKVDSLSDTVEYNTTLEIPKSFGEEIYVSPAPIENIETEHSTIYKFNKESIKDKGISASFGQYQYYNFKLNYKLKNDSILSNVQEISLPPDIKDKQQVSYIDLTPEPLKVYEDKDGNMIAQYRVKPKQEIEISLVGSAKLSGKQINPINGGKIEDLPKTLVRNYTKSDKYWEADSETIETIAGNLYDPDLTTSQNAKNVYDFVTTRLTYNFDITEEESISRHGALTALTTTGSWACMEFTDTFIAITRAMGIPAKELNGYALVQEGSLTPLSINFRGGDVLHSWAEFYDPNFGWVQVDPTWGNTSKIDYFTKMDTNHLVFSIKGLDSEYPAPAGAYKTNGVEKQVEVGIAQQTDETVFEPKITLHKIFTINTKKDKYLAINNSGVIAYEFSGGKDLLPYSTTTVLKSKGNTTFTYKDFAGKEFVGDFSIVEGYPKGYFTDIFKENGIILVILGALVLYMMIYASIVRPEILKKLRFRLRLLLRGRGR